MSRVDRTVHRRSRARGVLIVVALALAGTASALPGPGARAQEPAPAPQPAAPPAPDLSAPQTAPSEPSIAGPPPNLRINVVGNRRWCVRTREPVWPSTQVGPLPRRGRGRQGPLATSFGYAYYILALPEVAPPASAAQTAEAGAAEAGPQTTPAAEGSAEAQTRGGAEALEEETVTAEEAFAAAPPGQQEMEGSAADIDIAQHPGAIVVMQSPMFRTMSGRRYQAPGKPPEVRPFWDLSKSCCSFPNQVMATLPAGRYTLQLSFDVLMPRRGWKHVQLARREAVEIRDGETTELTLRVDTDGYVEVKPSGRVVTFEPAEPEASPAATPPPQTAPAARP